MRNSTQLQAEIDRARVVGEALEDTEPRAIKVWYAIAKVEHYQIYVS